MKAGLGRLSFSPGPRVPLIHQAEAAECGLACLAMVAGYHGHELDLATLRRRHAMSLKGATLADLMRVAGELKLAPRPLRLDLEHLQDLQRPAILHWDMNHFVVLASVRGGRVVIHDPGRGRRVLSRAELGRHFTGIALELRPTAEFRPRRERRPLTLRELWGRQRGVPGLMGQIILLSLVLQLFALAMPWFMQLTVDEVLLAADLDLLNVLGLGFALLVLLQVGVTALRAWIIQYLSTSLGYQVLGNLFAHLMRLPGDFFVKRHVGDIVSRFGSAEAVQRTLTTSFIEAIVDGLMVAAILLMMLVYSIKLTLVVLAAATLYFLIRWVLYRPLREATEEQIIQRARKESLFLETMRGIQSLQVFNRETARQGLFLNRLAEQMNAGIRIARWRIAYQAANGLLFGLENIAVIWLGALAVMEGGFSVGMLLAFVSYKSNFTGKAASLVEKLIEYRMLGLHLERVADLTREEPQKDYQGLPEDGRLLRGHVLIRNLGFRYAAHEPWILRHFDLEVLPGESVAITGPSGCGKSTLLRLLLGLLRPSEGCIEIDGVALERYGRARFRRQVGAVLQDDRLFAGSVADNITFFDEMPDPGRMMECARLAGIHEDIVRMPMGYETLVGDMGTTLSGGQQQRVMLARALYRQPRILLLDEATSHLDTDREQQINDAISQLNITRIIIAHRPETVASADRVVQLDNQDLGAGQAVEAPTAMSRTRVRAGGVPVA